MLHIRQPIYFNGQSYAHLLPKKSSYSFLGDKLHTILKGVFCCDSRNTIVAKLHKVLGVPFKMNGTQTPFAWFAEVAMQFVIEGRIARKSKSPSVNWALKVTSEIITQKVSSSALT